MTPRPPAAPRPPPSPRLREVVALVVGIPALSWLATTFDGACELERDALCRGEVWRLWTGHLVQSTRSLHLIWSAALAVTLLPVTRPRTVGLLVLAPVVGGGVLLWRGDLDGYRGLAGVFHGVLAWAALDFAEARRGLPRALVVSVVALLGVHLAVEVATAQRLLPVRFETGGVPVPEASLLGLLGAAALHVARRRLQREKVATTGA